MEFINVNGKILGPGKTFIRTDNHSYRYGDGLFETIKVADERMLLSDLHFERLWNGLAVLKFQIPNFFTRQRLEKEIIILCKKNKCEKHARARLSISNGNGGLFDGDEKLQYVIECWPLPGLAGQFNENGLVIGLFPDGKKTCDIFSNLKSANHLLYAMGARFGKENKLNDCLIINEHNRICDSTIANIFWIKSKCFYTPPLTEGCIAGVMRKNLIEKLQTLNYRFQEKICGIPQLENADEIFLTNAIQGIRWVKRFRNKNYVNTETQEIYSKVFNYRNND
ncbi:MAG: aminotransferase class IV [Chitinophagales bacterium]